jgi:enamine deaminase RidA (YjgF/YER057c/UK114 family)
VGNLIFCSGIEAVDYRNGGKIPETIEEQVDVVAYKINDTLALSGHSLGNMVKHTIYLKKGAADPKYVIALFHQACHKYAPSLKEYPSTGTLVVIEQLVLKEFMLEVDVIAALPA